jgi:hypothetical protein
VPLEQLSFDTQLPVVRTFDREDTELAFVVSHAAFDASGEGRLTFDRVRNQIHLDGRVVNFADTSTIDALKKGADEFSADYEAQHPDREVVAVLPNGNLGVNDWFVGVVDGQVYHRQGEALDQRAYDMLVTKQDGQISLMALRFMNDAGERGIFDEQGRNIAQEVKIAVYGQRLVKNGQVHLEAIADQFDDLRHLLRLPLFQVGSRQLHLGFSDDDGALYQDHLQVSKALRGEPVRLSLRPLTAHGILAEERERVFGAWGYTNVTGRKESEALRPGEYLIDEARQTMEVVFLPGIHPHTMVGIMQDGRLLVGAVEGRTHFSGARLSELAQDLIDRGAQDVFLWANGKDTFMRVGAEAPVQAQGARGNGRSAILITRKRVSDNSGSSPEATTSASGAAPAGSGDAGAMGTRDAVRQHLASPAGTTAGVTLHGGLIPEAFWTATAAAAAGGLVFWLTGAYAWGLATGLAVAFALFAGRQGWLRVPDRLIPRLAEKRRLVRKIESLGGAHACTVRGWRLAPVEYLEDTLIILRRLPPHLLAQVNDLRFSVWYVNPMYFLRRREGSVRNRTIVQVVLTPDRESFRKTLTHELGHLLIEQDPPVASALAAQSWHKVDFNKAKLGVEALAGILLAQIIILPAAAMLCSWLPLPLAAALFTLPGLVISTSSGGPLWHLLHDHASLYMLDLSKPWTMVSAYSTVNPHEEAAELFVAYMHAPRAFKSRPEFAAKYAILRDQLFRGREFDVLAPEEVLSSTPRQLPLAWFLTASAGFHFWLFGSWTFFGWLCWPLLHATRALRASRVPMPPPAGLSQQQPENIGHWSRWGEAQKTRILIDARTIASSAVLALLLLGPIVGLNMLESWVNRDASTTIKNFRHVYNLDKPNQPDSSEPIEVILLDNLPLEQAEQKPAPGLSAQPTMSATPTPLATAQPTPSPLRFAWTGYYWFDDGRKGHRLVKFYPGDEQDLKPSNPFKIALRSLPHFEGAGTHMEFPKGQIPFQNYEGITLKFRRVDSGWLNVRLGVGHHDTTSLFVDNLGPFQLSEGQTSLKIIWNIKDINAQIAAEVARRQEERWRTPPEDTTSVNMIAVLSGKRGNVPAPLRMVIESIEFIPLGSANNSQDSNSSPQ